MADHINVKIVEEILYIPKIYEVGEQGPPGPSGGDTSSPQTIIDGSISGLAIFSMPFYGSSYKKVIIYCDDLKGSATYIFPTPFVYLPNVIDTAMTQNIDANLTSVTIVGNYSTGFIMIEGF